MSESQHIRAVLESEFVKTETQVNDIIADADRIAEFIERRDTAVVTPFNASILVSNIRVVTAGLERFRSRLVLSKISSLSAADLTHLEIARINTMYSGWHELVSGAIEKMRRVDAKIVAKYPVLNL